MGITAEIASFVTRTRYADVPAEVIDLARGYVLDGLGVILAGSTTPGSRIIQEHVRDLQAKPEATVLGPGFKAPVRLAAFANGAAGHAMDYDDTQLSTSKEAVYGLLTHPTVPVLAALFPVAEVQRTSGRDFLAAYVLGVEVECRIADAIAPRHYQAGFHSTATMGGFGAVAGAAKLLRLSEDPLLRALGLVASMAAGLRENFGTMTKPFHAGRAAESGIVAVSLARRNFTAAKNILEAPRGFYRAAAGTFDEAKIHGRLGNPYYFLSPGVSIKPYPSGSLSHPAQDLILELVTQHDLKPEQIESIEVGTNSNVPNALIHNEPTTELEGKFSIPFCMAIGVLERKAGIAQFTDKKVRDPKTVALMKRVRLYVDPEMEALGFDLVRTVVKVRLSDGRVLTGRADVARGTPPKLMRWDELAEKFRDCARLVLPRERVEQALKLVDDLPRLPQVAPLVQVVAGGRQAPRTVGRKRTVGRRR